MAKVIITLDRNFGSKGINSDDSSVAPSQVFLTELELSALMAVALNGMDQMGGNEPADLHGDNCSWFNQGDIMSGAGVTTMQARGLMTFLNRKGLIADAEAGRKGALPKVDGTNEVRDHWAMTDAGINAAQHVWATIDQLDHELTRRRPALARAVELTGH